MAKKKARAEKSKNVIGERLRLERLATRALIS